MSAGQDERLKRNDEDAQTRILAVAGDLFAQHGYGGTSMRDVALAAGISKANVFHHFKSKEALYQAVLDSYSEANFRGVAEVLKPLSDSLEDRIAHIVSKHLDTLLHHPAHTRMLLLEAIASRENAEPRADAPDTLITELLKLIRGWQESGQVSKDVDAALLVSMILGANVYMFLFDDKISSLRRTKSKARLDAYSRNIARILTAGCTR